MTSLDFKLLKGILTEIKYLVRFEDTLGYCGFIGDKTIMFNYNEFDDFRVSLLKRKLFRI